MRVRPDDGRRFLLAADIARRRLAMLAPNRRYGSYAEGRSLLRALAETPATILVLVLLIAAFTVAQHMLGPAFSP
jgi:hypothetical protein